MLRSQWPVLLRILAGLRDMPNKRRSSSGGGPPASPATPQSGRVGERTPSSGKKDGKGRRAGSDFSTPGPMDVTLRMARSDAAAPGRLLMMATDIRRLGLRAGDWVIVVEQQSTPQTLDDRHKDDRASGRPGLVILRAWPSASLSQGTVLGSAPMVPAQFPAITSTAGAAVRVRPLSSYMPSHSVRSVMHIAAMVTIRRDRWDAERMSAAGSTSKSSMSDMFFRERLRELLTGLIVFKGLRLAITLFMQSYHFQITDISAHDRQTESAHQTALEAAASMAATPGGGAAPDVSEERGCQEGSGLLEASMSRLTLDETEREMELPQLYYFGREAVVRLVNSAAGGSTELGQYQDAPPIENDPWSIVGGLDRQIKEVKDGLQLPLTSSDVFAQHGLKPTRGLLLTGPPGTGKSLLIQAAVAHFRRQGVHTMVLCGSDMVSRLVGETEGRLRAAFAEARARAPTLLVIDDVEALGAKRDSGSSDSERRVVSTLLALMDGFDAMEKVVVLGATNKPAALDPALRRPGRFDSEIDIGVPGEDARRDILYVLLRRAGRCMGAPPQTIEVPNHDIHATAPQNGESASNGWIRISNEAIAGVAARAHGFVGADLMLLCKEAAMGSMRRRTAGGGSMTMEQVCITDDDLWAALKRVRPSALREVVVEVPRVHWTDIGGQESVKQALKECVEWPLRHPEAFARMGISPPKGVLMYGPPGCSKTLMARALATESGMNFLAVKGPELLSKWLGESERALQSLFKRARSAAPTVIFFDEIDALAGRRGQGDDSKASERVLSQLLTELDGVQPLRRVVVIAATNRPDLIDPALLRPGRLDRKVYVPPPDLPSRAEILRIALKGVTVEEGAIIFDALARASEGMSGAEVVAVCREASLMAIEEDPENAAYVRQDHLEKAVRGWKRQITSEVIEFYESFSERRS